MVLDIVKATKEEDIEAFKEILEHPYEKLAELITGIVKLEKRDIVNVVARITQSAIKGRSIEQLNREISSLIDSGKIPENYTQTKYGFKCLSDLLVYIDSDIPDEDMYQAAKDLFFLVASTSQEKHQSANYQLFKLVLTLNSLQVIVLKHIFNLRNEMPKYQEGHKGIVGYKEWLRDVSVVSGLEKGFVEIASEELEKKKIITIRTHSDNSGISPLNARLTELGIKICDALNGK